MSDDKPPSKPKPGSLRDRIAAFEQKPAANAPLPPAPRPKSGHVQWKPKPRTSSPPPPPINAEGEGGAHGMNPADAKESIGMGGLSLKERMAALQGRGAFAASAPAPPVPRPASDKPKWKPPPAPISPSDNEPETDHEVMSGHESAHASLKSPVSTSDAETGDVASEVTDGEKSSAPAHEGELAVEGGDDPDEERKRRAAIAARMARLGGARIGMGPPVFAPKSRSSTTSQPAASEEHAPAESADEASASDAPGTGMKIDLPSAPSEASLASADSASSARSPPTHMPVPSGPRRAVPPRRRPPKSPGAASGELPATPSDVEKDREETTPLGTAERDEKKLEDETPVEEEIPTEETEEEASARRKRIADRIAKSGGVNPFAAPRTEQEEEQDHAEAEAEAEISAEAPTEADPEAEIPPPSSDEVEEEAPSPLPSKITDEEANHAGKHTQSPIAFSAKEDEASVPVVDVSKPADVTSTLEDAEKHSVDITEAAAEFKDTDTDSEKDTQVADTDKEKDAKNDSVEVAVERKEHGEEDDEESKEIDYDGDEDEDEDKDASASESDEEKGHAYVHEAVTDSVRNAHALIVGYGNNNLENDRNDSDDDEGADSLTTRGPHAPSVSANAADDDDDRMAPPRITRPLPPTPPESDSEGDLELDDGHEQEQEREQEQEQKPGHKPNEEQVPPSTPILALGSPTTVDANNAKTNGNISPPPPPPPPPPPLPTPPIINKLRLVRRQSTSSHTRSATAPSSFSNPETPTLKRNNTINSFNAVAPQRPGHSRPSSPPPTKPKPAALSQKRKTHERAASASATPLLKTALVQGAVAVTGEKPEMGVDAVRPEMPERRSSVSQLAKSLESSIHFAPPSPPTRRGSVQTPPATKKTFANPAPTVRATGDTMSTPASPPANLKAAIASLAAVKSFNATATVTSSFPPPAPPAPPPPPTPPLSPSSTSKTQPVSSPSPPPQSSGAPSPPPPPPPPPVLSPEKKDVVPSLSLQSSLATASTVTLPSGAGEPDAVEKPEAPAKRLSVLPPSREPPPPPADVDADAKPAADKEEEPPKPPQRAAPPLLPPTPVDEEARGKEEDLREQEGDKKEKEGEGEGVLEGGIVVEEPEEMDEMGEIQDEQVHVDSDSADDGDDDSSSSSGYGQHQSFKSALSQNDSASGPPTPPKRNFSFPLTSKWSRNTSAVPSANASASTLSQSQTQSQEDTLGNDIDSRFPPMSSFPPPPPLPFKKSTAKAKTMSVLTERKLGFGSADESSASLTSLPEGRTLDERDRESNDLPFQAKTKATLTSAIAAALAKSPPELTHNPSLSRTATDSVPSRSSGEETDPLARQVKARLAKLDAIELPRPAPFPSLGEGSEGQSQSAPEVPSPHAGADDGTMRQVRLSSKLLPITGAVRMNTTPVSAWGKHKMVMSNETIGTIGTIATEPGDLDTSVFGGPSFLNWSKGDKRPAMRRQTTSQSSRFVEDLPIPLPFLKRSVSPTPQRAATLSFSTRARTGSEGPPTRKMSLVPELRAATVEAAERPMSSISGDFVLVEEPEEFDIPRAEWDLPRIPSGSLGFPSTVDLSKPNWAERSRSNSPAPGGGSNGFRKAGPSSAPPTTAPSVPVAPVMLHSRSVSGTTGTSGTSRTATSAPSMPLSSPPSTGSDGGARLSSDALLDLWGRVGVYVSDAAALLHDKSRRVLVGDGTYPGFVLAVSRQVPAACIPSRTARYPYGHLIYFQTAGTVHKRYAEIMPGDVIVLQNALFKGVKGPLYQSYQDELGTRGEPVVGVIGEFEVRKTKVRVYQANQHVGVQTVEYVSYRFEDLKSGTIKIFRVPDS